ncbi:MAG TPA: hypothetical protein H9734_04430 [Candidatus Fusicatenibacter merdavium]|uniref:Uncharacterized protein n=1 Tax=Candidatus Fusicatenibacter merdavium TaxID=2838600 RepID=A0A9D2BI17_9FIRM|nr:hypothetical protein [Candidatus Fusicatenibacter merdavium]
MSYSLWMAVLSPVSGAAADVFSVPAAFLGLGLIVIILSWGYVLQTARKKVS